MTNNLLFGLYSAFRLLGINTLTMITVAAMIRAIITAVEATPLMMATVLSELSDRSTVIDGPTGSARKI